VRNAIKDSETYALLTTKPKVLLQTSPALVRLLLRLGLDLRPEYVPHVVAGWYLPENAARGWDLTQHLLRGAAKGSRRRRRPHGSGHHPQPHAGHSRHARAHRDALSGEAPVDEFLADPDRPQRMLQQFANEHGIAVLDTTPILRANGAERCTTRDRALERERTQSRRGCVAGVIGAERDAYSRPLGPLP
jgi:hypothetical protein